MLKLLNLLGFWSEASLISMEISQVEFACNGEEEEVQNERCYAEISLLGAAQFWLDVGCCLFVFSYSGGMANEWKWLDFLCLQCMR